MLAIAAAPARAQESAPAAALRAVLEDVPAATHHRYDAKDDRGLPLEALDVIQTPSGYLGISHAVVAGRFELNISTSKNLLDWDQRAALDTDASQGAIAAVGNGFIVAYEKASTLSLVPRIPLPPELAVLQGLVDRINLRLRYYPSLERLLAGNHSRQFTAPLTLSGHAEGTPHFISAVLSPDLRHSRIELGFHYFEDIDGDGFPDVDRQASATLTGWRSWRTRDEPALNQSFLSLTELHEGFSAPPAGNIGDRSEVRLGGQRLLVHEAQYTRNDFGSWRLFLRDVAAGTLRALRVRTHGGSRAFGNASVARITAPSGRPATLFTAFLFSEGAAPGEAGELIVVSEDASAVRRRARR